MNTSDIPEVVERYITAVNARDWPAIAPCFTSDAEFWTLGTQKARGSTQIADHLRRTFEGQPDHHDEVTRVVTAGGLSFVEMTLRLGAPEDRPVEISAADIFELSPDGTTIARVAAWFDAGRRTAQ